MSHYHHRSPAEHWMTYVAKAAGGDKRRNFNKPYYSFGNGSEVGLGYMSRT